MPLSKNRDLLNLIAAGYRNGGRKRLIGVGFCQTGTYMAGPYERFILMVIILRRQGTNTGP